MLELKDVSVVFNEGTVNEKSPLIKLILHLIKGILLQSLEVMVLVNQLYFKLFLEQLIQNEEILF